MKITFIDKVRLTILIVNFTQCLAYVTCNQKVADSNPADAIVNGCSTFAENI